MKSLAALVVGLAVVASVNVATAYVVQIVAVTPVTAATAEDTTQLGDALRSAIRDVLDHAIAFTPTVVTIENARIIGDRLYVILLIADQDGESTIEALSKDRAPESDEPDPEGPQDSPPNVL